MKITPLRATLAAVEAALNVVAAGLGAVLLFNGHFAWPGWLSLLPLAAGAIYAAVRRLNALYYPAP
jgi:hypothetical protein